MKQRTNSSILKSDSPILNTALHSVTQRYTALHSVTQRYTALHSVTQRFSLLLFIFFCFINVSFGQSHIQQNHDKKYYTPWQYHSNIPYSNFECSIEPWKLVFYDEFDGTVIDGTKWYTFSPDGGGANPPCSAGLDDCFWARGRDGRTHGKFEGLFLDQNVEVDNGILKLHVKKETNTWYDSVFHYSAAMIWSKPNFQFQYGKFEARIKMHAGGGFFPSFWLMGGREIDIIEYKGGKNLTEYPTTLHKHSGNPIQDVYTIKDINGTTIDFSQGFHTYSVEWAPDFIIWYVDGHAVRRFFRYQTRLIFSPIPFNCSNYESSKRIRESLFMDDSPMSVIFNTSIMNKPDSHGAIDDDDFPSFMEVEYVRVYQRFPQDGKYDLCGGTIDGFDEICVGNQETYEFIGDYSNITWTASSNLDIIGTTANTITVSPSLINGNFTVGSVTATVNFSHAPCSTKTFTKQIQNGVQTITGTVNLGAPYYTSQALQTVHFLNSNTFNVTLDNPSYTYNWQLVSGNGSVGGATWNPQLITIPSNSTSASFGISTLTDCGSATKTVAFVNSSGWYRISPNPANNYILIEAIEDYEVEHSGDNGEITTTLIQPTFRKATLYNFQTGEQVLEQDAYSSVKNMTIDIGNLSTGNYILKIKNDYTTTTHQIVIR